MSEYREMGCENKTVTVITVIVISGFFFYKVNNYKQFKKITENMNFENTFNKKKFIIYLCLK